MTFSCCYIGHICLTFQITSLQTTKIFGSFGVSQNCVLDLVLDPLCPPIASGPLVCAFLIQNFKNLLQNDTYSLLHRSYLPHFPNSIVANFELRL